MKNFAGRSQQLREALETDSTIAAVYLFGSHARGTAIGTSDIDIGILFQSGIDASRYFDLRLELIARIMAVLLTEKVDVVVLNDAPLHLTHEVISHGDLLLEKDPRQRAAFEADRIGRFLDFKPFLAAQVSAIKEHLAKGTYFD
jgi:predicted nucleotidyltransferase